MSSTLPPDLEGLDYVQPLGSGGYADVFLYEQQMPRMKVAVKVLKADGLTPGIKRQFIDEANTMAHLADHPFIVQIFRAGTAEDGRPYLVMKYYPPPNLAQRARAERFSVEEVLRTGIHLASAVETAHRAGVIHRDIKPANVLVSQYGTPGLTDFGIAGRGGVLEDLDDDVGVSVPWAPPEVLFGQSNGDARADVYSLAATLWQLLVGRSPFEVPGGDNTTYALMPRIRSNPPPSTGRADVPAGMERLLAQAMAKNPLARPATALELARSLQQIEQEARFARTAIVVLDEQGHSGDVGGPPVSSQERTRLRTSPAPAAGAPTGSPPKAGTSAGRSAAPPPPTPTPPPVAGSQPAARAGTAMGSSATPPPPPLSQPVIAGQLSGGRSIAQAPPTRIADGVADLPGSFAQGTATTTRSGTSTGSTGTDGAAPPGPGGERPSGKDPQEPRPKGIQVGLLPVVLTVVGVLLVVALIVAAVWWTGRDDGETVTTSTSGDPGQAGLGGRPEVEVQPTSEGGDPRMSITVSYESLQEDDVVRLRAGEDEQSLEGGGTDWPLAAGETETYEVVSPGARRCYVARVERGDQRTAWSAPRCETAVTG